MKPAFIPYQPPPSHRPATQADLSIICAHLLEECRLECLATTGLDTLTSLSMDRPNTVVLDGKNGLPICALSIYKVSEHECAVWIAATGALSPTALAARLAPVFAEVHSTYRTMHAMADARNVTTALILRACGFSFVQRFEQFGKEQRPFGLYTAKLSPACTNQLH